MKTIKVKASSSYEILVDRGLISNSGKIINKIKHYKKAVIVTDDIVNKLYSDAVIESLRNEDISVSVFVFKNGEESKSHDTLLKLYDYLVENEITRSDLLIALGGGVVGDLTGFAAATYLRGIDYVQIPTTLLAQVDSSVGGKTAVNISGGKNLIGAFKQPICVICDIDTLKTLSNDILIDGIGEAIKYGMIKSESLFYKFAEGNFNDNLLEIVCQCISIKRDVVEADEFDNGERMLLNFGHTLGHAIEKHTDFKISHGKAVAMGMYMITCLSEKMGYTDENTAKTLLKCLNKFGLANNIDFSTKDLMKYCLNDKKRMSDSINIILCKRIGESEVVKMPVDKLKSLLVNF